MQEIITFGMEDAKVSFSTGAMNSILTKLETLIVKGMDGEQELMILMDELKLMNGLLEQLSDMPDLNDEMKKCRNQMRELTYEIDDSIDDLMFPSVDKKNSEVVAMISLVPHDFLDQIQKLNGQVQTADLQMSRVPKAERLIFGPRSMPRKQWLTSVYCYELQKLAERDEQSEESTSKIFAELPSYMKTCLLYLCRFPDDEVLKKDKLIRMWAAEGFLPKGGVQTWWETGENCFLEFIVKKLTEPVYDFHVEDVLPTGCRCFDSVRQLIATLSSEEKFGKPWELELVWNRNVTERDFRFKIRSLIIDYSNTASLLDLSTLKYVRVLDIQYLHNIEQLRNVRHLSMLKYLGLNCSRLNSLPQEITTLEHLETVHLRHTYSLEELPMFKSRKLVSLVVDSTTIRQLEKIRLSKEMGELNVLEELSTVNVYGPDDAQWLANVVNESKQLRRLGIIIDDGMIRSALMDLLVAIGNSNIQSVSLEDQSCDPSVLLDSLLGCWAKQRPRYLQKLHVVIRRSLPEVLQNVSASLVYLTHLQIQVVRLNTEGLCILGNLTNLVVLGLLHEPLWSSDAKERILTESSVITNKGFQCLRVLQYYSYYYIGLGLQFEAGAMPQLQRLRLQFNARDDTEFDDIGIQFLTSLVQVHATIRCEDRKRASIEAAMTRQLSQNPNKPLIKIKMLELLHTNIEQRNVKAGRKKDP